MLSPARLTAMLPGLGLAVPIATSLTVSLPAAPVGSVATVSFCEVPDVTEAQPASQGSIAMTAVLWSGLMWSSITGRLGTGKPGVVPPRVSKLIFVGRGSTPLRLRLAQQPDGHEADRADAEQQHAPEQQALPATLRRLRCGTKGARRPPPRHHPHLTRRDRPPLGPTV